MREFGFEVRLCAHLEGRWPVVARQLGASVGAGGGHRVVDTLLVERGPAFDDRVALSLATIPAAAVESDAGPGRFRPVTDVLPGPPERARRVAERAADAGFFELDRRDGDWVVRQVARYPDWYGDLVGVENKPDLSAPGDLQVQLRKDVALGLLDRVVLATASHVTGAHRNRIPEEVGIWRVHLDSPDPVEVVREPTPLPSDGPGVQVLDTHPGRTDVRPVGAEAKARKRRRVAERAYGKGWRPAVPACERARPARVAGTRLPDCEWKGCLVDASADCGPDCGGHAPADPPAVDPEGERARHTPWDPDPPGAVREQTGLDRFG